MTSTLDGLLAPEAGPPRAAAELEALVAASVGGSVRAHRRGSMAYLVAEGP